MTTNPIHVDSINSNNVRFFKTPLNDGRPDFPWHSVDDLTKAVGLNREQRQYFLRGSQQDHAKLHRTIATPDGLTTIAPHCVAQGFLGAMVHVSRAPKSIELEYTRAVTAAGELLPYSQTLDGVVAAYHRWNSATTSTKGA